MDLSVFGTFVGYFLIIAGQFIYMKMTQVDHNRRIVTLEARNEKLELDIKENGKILTELRIVVEGMKKP